MKRILCLALSVLMVCTMLFALAACGDDSEADESSGSGVAFGNNSGKNDGDTGNNKGSALDGTYYLYDETEGKCDMTAYIKIENGQWSDEEDGHGECKIDGNRITLMYKVVATEATGAIFIEMGLAEAGDMIEAMSGTIVGSKLTIDKSMGIDMGAAAIIGYLNGVVTDGNSGNTGNTGNNGDNTGSAGTDGSADGTYYLYDEIEGKCDMTAYIKIENGQWSDEEDGHGECKINGNKITLMYKVVATEATGAMFIEMGLAEAGDTIEVYTGTIEDGKMSFDKMMGIDLGGMTVDCYLNGIVK